MRGTPYLFSGFVGGLNSLASPYELEPDESRECLNVVSTQRGSIKKRYGSTAFSGASTPNVELTSIFPVTTAAGTFLVAAGSTKLYSVGTGGVVTEIGSGFTSGARWSVCQAPKGTKKTAGPVYLVNGKDKPQFWSGAAAGTAVALWEGESAEVESKKSYENVTTKEHVPNGKFMVFAGNRVWMAGMSDDTSAVRFSEDISVGEGGEQNDPTWWPSNNVVRFDTSDGNPITGLGVVGPYVLVFKESKIWAIHNMDTGENRKIADRIGCVANRSIVETQMGTFFLTADQGVYLTDGSKLQEMSYKVRPTILAVNPAQRENAAGAYLNNHYYLSYASGSSSVPNRTLDYDAQLKSWWPHDLAGNQWAVWEPTTGETVLYTIPPKAKAGVVKAFDPTTYQDSGVNYVGNETLGAFWLSAWDPFSFYIARHRLKAPFLKKRVRQVHFDGSGEIVPIVFKNFQVAGRPEPGVVGNADMTKPETPVNFEAGAQEYAAAGQTWGSEATVWGGAAPTSDARIYAPGVARVWSVGWGNSNNKGFEVDSYMLSVIFRKS